MQCKFLIAFVLMGVCLIQTTSGQPSIIFGETQKSAHENKLIQKIIDQIQLQINEALNTLNELKFKVTELKNQAIEAMKQKLQKIMGKAKEAIEKIKKQAEHAGIDISDCVKEEGKFQEWFDKVLADEVHCVTGEVDEIMRIITETDQMITNAIDDLKGLQNDLQNCTTNSRPITCITGVTLNALKMQKDIPLQIATKVNEVTKFVAGLQTRLETCATSQLASAGIAAAGIVGDIVKCAADKGLEHINK